MAVFTPNISGALKLIGEGYPFNSHSQFALTVDNHHLVNGIRDSAQAEGAAVQDIPLLSPTLRLDTLNTLHVLQQANPQHNNLFALPPQSHFSGVQHPLSLVKFARACGWDVLLDCTAFVPTKRCDIGQIKPDYAVFSFYQMFGHTTGLGCLVVRKDKLAKLNRPWLVGGKIEEVSVAEVLQKRPQVKDTSKNETLNYFNIPAVEIGLRFMERVGIDVINTRIKALTGWLIDSLLNLKHANGRPVIELLGPANTISRGGTITFLVQNPEGKTLDLRKIKALARRANISLSIGCTPGAAEYASDISGSPFLGGIRLSLGIVSNFTDTHAAVEFFKRFIDQMAVSKGEPKDF